MSSEDQPRSMPKTRGGSGMPPDRSGKVVQHPSASPEVRRAAQIAAKQELARKKATNDLLKKRVTVEELHSKTDPLFGMLTQVQRTMEMALARQEAILITLIGSDEEKKKEYGRVFNNILRWRGTVAALEDGDYQLREIHTKILEWNADADNFPITFDSFDTQKLFMKFMRDLDMNKGEKEQFMLDLKFPPEIHAKFLERFEESLKSSNARLADELVDSLEKEE